jgi:hypothetical protein|nr:MAG TPA: hypothetical protein [Caudoviricetes sp.]
MKNLVIVEQITATTANEVEKQVKEQMKRFGYYVVADEQEAKTFFLTFFGKEMSDRTAQQFQLDGEINGDWQTTIYVTIREFSCSGNTDDYLYTVEVTED